MKKKFLKGLAWGLGSCLIFVFYFWWISILGQQHHENNPEPRHDEKTPIESSWRFLEGDFPSAAKIEFDDSHWLSIPSDSLPDDYSGAPAWFRLKFGPSVSKETKTFSIFVEHFGASEIYFDGNPVAGFGKVSKDPKKEQLFQPETHPFTITVDPSRAHVIAVRYSFVNAAHFQTAVRVHHPGFKMFLTTPDLAVHAEMGIRSTLKVTTSIGAFLFTLALIHFLLYLFYRKASENLYFSIFSVCYAAIFFLASMSNHLSDCWWLLRCEIVLMALANPILFFTLLLYVYKVQGSKLPRVAWLAVLSSVLGLGYVLFGWFGMEVYSMSGVWLTVFTVITMILGTLRAIKEKRPGSRILGVSNILFALFLFALLSLLFYNAGNGLHITLSNPIFLVVILCVMLCVPVSMSVYLAYSFSITNLSLEKKLHEVEELSAKTIEQEKERQRILEGQKELLETQVLERTAEIVEQKKIIEEKNKDITDSINYAKRIQDSILPGTDLIRSVFPDSFVLFKPKDIVSGDFYWFGKVDGWQIAVCADCTGHGVPGALMSMIGTNLLHQAIIEKKLTSPENILSDIQHNLLVTLKQIDGTICAPTRVTDGMDVAIFCYHPMERKALFAGAQRPLWRIRDGQLEEFKGDKIPISASGEPYVTFHLCQPDLKKGDLFVMSSDGYADQFGGTGQKSGGKKLMTKEFKNRLIQLASKDMMGIELALDQEFERWKGGLEQMDDVCVIGIRV